MITRRLIPVTTVGAVLLGALLSCSDLGEPLVREPRCDLSTDAMDFGQIPAGTTADMDFVISNNGDAPLAGDVEATSPVFHVTVGAGPFELEPDEMLTVTVRYAPPDTGSNSAEIMLGSGCVSVTASGEAVIPVAGAMCTVTPPSLDFGEVTAGAFVDKSFTIRNDGAFTFTGNITSPCGAYTMTQGGGAFMLSPGDSLQATVRFEPAGFGQATCTIATGVNCDDVPCTGSGAPTISFSSDVQPIFTGNCVASLCHTGARAAGDMRLTTGVSWVEIVNVTTTGYAPAKRVVPFEPALSVLNHKINADGYGAEMPPNAGLLSPADRNTIRVWIEEGARDN